MKVRYTFILLVFVSLLVLVFISLQHNNNVSTPDIEMVKKTVSSKFPNFTITEIKVSEIAGVYELYGNNNIIYVDSKAEHIIVGHILDMAGKDLTQSKIDALSTDKTYDLTSVNDDTFLTIIYGKGSNSPVYMFTAPDCPYCADADKYLSQLDLTLKVAFLPLSTTEYATHILCSDSPSSSFKNIMNLSKNYFDNPKVSFNEYLLDNNYKIESCEVGEVQLSQMQALTNNIGVKGTPSFIINNKLFSGFTGEVRNILGSL